MAAAEAGALRLGTVAAATVAADAHAAAQKAAQKPGPPRGPQVGDHAVAPVGGGDAPAMESYRQTRDLAGMQALLDRSYPPLALAAGPCSEFLATGFGSSAGAMCNVEGCFKKGAPLTIKAVISSHGHARAVKHLEALEKLAPGAGASRIAMDKHKKRPQPPSSRRRACRAR